MYDGYLIANFETGFDRERQPWLLPDDAQFQLLDGYVYRGVWQKREGYSQYATGQKGGALYCESRMVHRVTAEAYSTGNGTKGPYTHTEANLPVRRGTVTITAGGQTAVDDGVGGFVTAPAGDVYYLSERCCCNSNHYHLWLSPGFAGDGSYEFLYPNEYASINSRRYHLCQ